MRTIIFLVLALLCFTSNAGIVPLAEKELDRSVFKMPFAVGYFNSNVNEPWLESKLDRRMPVNQSYFNSGDQVSFVPYWKMNTSKHTNSKVYAVDWPEESFDDLQVENNNLRVFSDVERDTVLLVGSALLLARTRKRNSFKL